MNRYVFSIKWGTRYGSEYVNRLYRMTQRQLTLDHEFICFTDDVSGLEEGITTYPLPELGVPHPENVPGKWSKTALWQAELFGLKGVALFIDLDTVIVNKIDCFFSYGNPKDVIVTRNWLKPTQKLGQTTLFRYPVGGNPQVYTDFQKAPQETADKHQFEQHYVTSKIGEKLRFWPGKWVKHYRHHCLTNNYLLRYMREAKVPSGARIIAFPGEPNPLESVEGRWNANQATANTPLNHLKATFKKESRVKPSILGHLKCYQRPCSWIKDHWVSENENS